MPNDAATKPLSPFVYNVYDVYNEEDEDDDEEEDDDNDGTGFGAKRRRYKTFVRPL